MAVMMVAARLSSAQCGTSIVWHGGGSVQALVAGPSERLYTGVNRQLRILSTADPSNPVLLGTAMLDDVPRQLELDGDYLYVLLYDGGVRIFNVSDPAAPVEVSSISGVEPASIAVASNKLYLAVPDAGAGYVRIFGVSNPASPTLVSNYFGAGDPVAVEAKSNILFIAFTSEVQAVDCSNAALPAYQGSYTLAADTIATIAVRQDLMGVARRSGQTDIVDVSNVTSMPRRSFFNSTTSQSAMLEFAQSGGTPYLYYFGPSGNISCATLSNPANPVLHPNIRSYTAEIWNGVSARAGRLWVGENFRLAGYDMTTPASPVTLLDQELELAFVGGLLTFGESLVAYDNGLVRVYDTSSVASATPVTVLDIFASPLYPDACSDGVTGYFLDGLLLKRVDFSDPSAPIRRSDVHLARAGERVVVRDGLAYVARWGDLDIYDLSGSSIDPPIGHVAGTGHVDRLCVENGYAYMIDQGGGAFGDPVITVADVRNPAAATTLGVYHARTGQTLRDAIFRGRYGYIAQSDDLLEVYDVSNPMAPVLRDSEVLADTDTLAFAHNLLLVGGIDGKIRYFDVSQPGTLAPMTAQTNNGATLWSSCFRDQWLWVAGGPQGVNAVRLPGKPLIEEPPQDQPACAQGVTEFRVRLANSTAGTTFQWRRNSIPLGNGTNGNGTIISGTTTNTLRLESPAVADFGDFDCVVTNSCGSTTTSSAVMYSVTAPTIIVQPHDEPVCEDGGVTLSVGWLGTPPATYQWQAVFPAGSGLWVNLTDSTTARFSVSGSQTRFLSIAAVPGQTLPASVIETSYRCIVSNVCTDTTSNSAALTVVDCSPPCDPDYNLDGNADQDDVAYLVNVIAGGPNPSGRDPDFTRDGNVDQDDYAALVNVIAGGPCP